MAGAIRKEDDASARSGSGLRRELVDHAQGLVGQLLHLQCAVPVREPLRRRQTQIVATLGSVRSAGQRARIDIDEVGYDVLTLTSVHVRPRRFMSSGGNVVWCSTIYLRTTFC